MSNFPRTLIKEFADNLDLRLKEYFEVTKPLYSYPVDDYESLIADVLDTKFESIDCNVKYIYEKERENRKKRRQTWVSKTKSNIQKYPADNSNSYFHTLRIELPRNVKYYQKEYGTTNVEKIINQILFQIEEWKKNRELLILFPNFPHVGNIRMVDILYSDIAYSICEYILKNHKRGFQDFDLKQPISFISNPIFSGQKGTVPIERSKNKLIASLFSSDTYNIRFTDIQETEFDSKIPVLDSKDQTITSCLINNAKIDVLSNTSLSQKQVISLSDVMEAVYKTKHPSSSQRNDVMKRLKKLTTPFEIYNKETGNYVAWVLLDYIEIKQDDEGPATLLYTLGSVASDAIIKNTMISVPSSKYLQLESPYAKTLYNYLQLNRIMLARDNKEMVKTFTYDNFIQTMLLRYKSMVKNRQIVRDTLEECKQKQVAIEDYKVHDSFITLTFIPLSVEEYNDFVAERALPVIEDQDHFSKFH